MNTLASLQKSIASGLMRPLLKGELMDPAGAALAEEFIRPNDRLSAFERLQIYNQQYWWRLLANFADDFKGLRAVLGVRKFDQLALAYLTEHGSTSWNLRDLGKNLPDFLGQHPELAAPQSRLALEMAQMEWAQIEAFDGDQRPPLDPAKLSRVAPGRLRLKLQPYISLLELQYPIDTLLEKLSQQDIETDSLSNAVAHNSPRPRRLRLRAKPSPTPIYMAVHRLNYMVYFKRLDAPAFRLLSALRAGVPLEAACQSALEGHPSAPAQVQAWFSLWMRLGWLCG